MRAIDADALLEQYGLKDATKYGNENAEQQHKSYSTLMMYEIADMIYDAPTTAEIVAFLERLQTAIGSNRHSELWHYEQIISNARSRLEQLERENADLTARAEKAEAERDAADNGSYDLYKRFESISDEVREESPSCKLCGNFPESCAVCLKYNAFELRGLRGKGNA